MSRTRPAANLFRSTFCAPFCARLAREKPREGKSCVCVPVGVQPPFFFFADGQAVREANNKLLINYENLAVLYRFMRVNVCMAFPCCCALAPFPGRETNPMGHSGADRGWYHWGDLWDFYSLPLLRPFWSSGAFALTSRRCQILQLPCRQLSGRREKKEKKTTKPPRRTNKLTHSQRRIHKPFPLGRLRIHYVCLIYELCFFSALLRRFFWLILGCCLLCLVVPVVPFQEEESGEQPKRCEWGTNMKSIRRWAFSSADFVYWLGALGERNRFREKPCFSALPSASREAWEKWRNITKRIPVQQPEGGVVSEVLSLHVNDLILQNGETQNRRTFAASAADGNHNSFIVMFVQNISNKKKHCTSAKIWYFFLPQWAKRILYRHHSTMTRFQTLINKSRKQEWTIFYSSPCPHNGAVCITLTKQTNKLNQTNPKPLQRRLTERTEITINFSI